MLLEKSILRLFTLFHALVKGNVVFVFSWSVEGGGGGWTRTQNM